MSIDQSSNIRAAIAEDAAATTRIYNYYVQNTTVSFEEQSIDSAEQLARMRSSEVANLPWLVAESKERIEGFAYASLWRPRAAYRHSVEVTIYVDPESVGCGVGVRLYTKLFDLLRQRNFRTALATIALPNEASIALHEKLGMRKAAHFAEVGYKMQRWIDVGVWQARLTD